MERRLFKFALSLVVLLGASQVFGVDHLVSLICRTNATTAPYGVKHLNLNFLSKDLIQVSFYEFYSLTDEFVSDGREFSDFAVFKNVDIDVTKYPDGPITPLKVDKKLLDLLDTPRSNSAYAVAARGRRVAGQVRLVNKDLEDVVYDCRER